MLTAARPCRHEWTPACYTIYANLPSVIVFISKYQVMLSADTYVVHEHPSRPSIRQKRVAWFVLRLAGFKPDFRLAV